MDKSGYLASHFLTFINSPFGDGGINYATGKKR